MQLLNTNNATQKQNASNRLVDMAVYLDSSAWEITQNKDGI
jgi:hypothetical protein